jgi:hypothetical protein
MPSAPTGFQAQYFAGQTLDPANLKLTRTDSLINFSWGQGSPASSIGNDNFSARWTGQIQAPTSGSYKLTTTSDDGVRLWVNGQQLVNNWTPHSVTDNTGTITLQAGQTYDIKMEYFEKGGDATAALKWTRPDGITEFVPSAPASVASGPVNLSSLNWLSATNGYGPVEKDRSNGDIASGDGRTLTLNGKTYGSGLGAHADSEIVYALNGQYSQFTSDIGVDDEVGSNGSVTFQVWADGSKLYDSGTMRGNSTTQAVKVDLTGKQQLKLVVNSAGDGAAQDHGDWAGAQLLPLGYTPPPVSGSVTGLSSLNWISATNGYGPVEKNRSNGEAGASDGRPITLNGTGYFSGLGVHANSEIVYNLNGQYNQFTSDIGIDDEVGNSGSVTFQVWVDGSKLYDSGRMQGSSATKTVNVDVTGKQQLRLVVTDAGDGTSYDHADWAGARLTVRGATSAFDLAPYDSVVNSPNDAKPDGVPSYYSWYTSAAQPGWGNSPRTDWNAVTAWGQVYAVEGWRPQQAPNTRVQIKDNQLWILSKSTGKWTQTQLSGVQGGAFASDFGNNGATGVTTKDESANGGGLSVTAGNGYNYHFWPGARAVMNPTDIGGVYSVFQGRLILDNPNGSDDRSQAKYIASGGADYWRSVDAPFANDWSNNGGVGGGRFKTVTNTWQSYSFATLTPEQLLGNPPPIPGVVISA